MYAAIPPVSKVWFTSAIASSLLARFSLVDPSLLLLNWPAVWNKWQVRSFFGAPTLGEPVCSFTKRQQHSRKRTTPTRASGAPPHTRVRTSRPSPHPVTPQVWRLPASAVFFGEPSFGWIITMMML